MSVAGSSVNTGSSPSSLVIQARTASTGSLDLAPGLSLTLGCGENHIEGSVGAPEWLAVQWIES